MKKNFMVLLVFVLWVPSISIASSWGSGGKGFESGLFWGADLNRDERLDQNEAKGVYNLAEDDIFARYDEDQSGYITPLEFREYIQQSPWVDRFVPPEEQD